MFSGLFTIVLMVLFIGIVFILPVYQFFVVKDREAAASDSHEARKSRILLTGIIVALAASCLAYKILVAHHLEQTSALFIGLPALLAILVVLFAKPKTATGMLCMATLTALLMSGIFLGEGFVCITAIGSKFKGGDGDLVTFTIHGAQFDPNAIVKLSRPVFVDMEPVSYRVADTSRIVGHRQDDGVAPNVGVCVRNQCAAC